MDVLEDSASQKHPGSSLLLRTALSCCLHLHFARLPASSFSTEAFSSSFLAASSLVNSCCSARSSACGHGQVFQRVNKSFVMELSFTCFPLSWISVLSAVAFLSASHFLFMPVSLSLSLSFLLVSFFTSFLSFLSLSCLILPARHCFMVVKHLNLEGRREKAASHVAKPIERLKRGWFAPLARHNETACGRHVYTPSSESGKEWERSRRGKVEEEWRWIYWQTALDKAVK